MAQRPFFFFHQLGFKRNPFGALSDEEWAQIAVLPTAVTAVLPQSHHLQILGPKGCGKSTTLRGIARHLDAAGQRVAYEYLPEGQNRFITPLAGLEVFCLDEAQRLCWQEQYRLWRAAPRVRLVLGTHRRLWPLARRQTCKTINLVKLIDAAHWRTALQQRLACFALSPAAIHLLSESAILWLYENYGRDLREGEYFLYEVWQRIKNTEPLTAQKLQQLHEQLSGESSQRRGMSKP